MTSGRTRRVTESDKRKHKVYLRQSGRELRIQACKGLVEHAICETLRYEAVDEICVINVLVTGDRGIRKYNRTYRDIDSATDVLSFPMQDFIHSGWDGLSETEIDKDTGYLPLGDIVISSESVRRQADEYGHSVEDEMAYLIIHSTLHLLGYDHDNEANEKVIHDKCKAIIRKIGLRTNDK